MRIIYKGCIYESTLLEMPELISLEDDDDVRSNEIDRLVGNAEEVDSQYYNGTNYSIMESKTNASILLITDNNDDVLGYVKFNKMYTIKNAISIQMTYLFEDNRGQGIMSTGYEYLVNYYGAIVSDDSLTDDSYALYQKLAKKYNSYVYDYKNKEILPIKFDSHEYNKLDGNWYVEGTSKNYRVVISQLSLI